MFFLTPLVKVLLLRASLLCEGCASYLSCGFDLARKTQDSLGGTAKTLMFVNCSPAFSNLDETTMSLKYARKPTEGRTPKSSSAVA